MTSQPLLCSLHEQLQFFLLLSIFFRQFLRRSLEDSWHRLVVTPPAFSCTNSDMQQDCSQHVISSCLVYFQFHPQSLANTFYKSSTVSISMDRVDESLFAALPPVSLLDSSSWCLSLPWRPSRLVHPSIFQMTFNCSGIMFFGLLSTIQHIPIGHEALHQKKIFEWSDDRTWSWMKPWKPMIYDLYIYIYIYMIYIDLCVWFTSMFPSILQIRFMLRWRPGLTAPPLCLAPRGQLPENFHKMRVEPKAFHYKITAVVSKYVFSFGLRE